MASGKQVSKIIARTPSKENKKKFEEASKQTKKATEFKKSKILGMFPQSSLDKKQAELSRREAVAAMNKIPKEERTMMQLPEGLAKGGMPKVTKKKKTTKVAKRKGDGICSRGKTRGRMV